MDQNQFERRLAAILHADVVGYSELMGRDEVGTHQLLIESLDRIKSQIEKFSGTVVNFAGDAVLAEFSSPVNAVQCAVEIQSVFNDNSKSLDEDRRLKFRIGINLGDVIVARNDIYGDGVNVAARIQGLAKPGGICVSGSVVDQVKNKLAFGYEYLGEQKVKNIAEPVRTYYVITDKKFSGQIVGEKKTKTFDWKYVGLISAIFIIILGAVIAALWYNFQFRQETNSELTSEKSEKNKPTSKPSIAVLPFKNISGDNAKDYFSDGITEDIINDLSKFHGLFVIASNTVFTYKGKSVDIHEVSQDLGVRYVLEGSVQRSTSKIRVNTQLINSATGHSVWSERYTRDLTDLFDIQDEIVRNIVATLAVKVDVEERKRAQRSDTENLRAYDYILRGRELRARTSRLANAEARKMIREAIKLDPQYSLAYVELGWIYMDAIRFGWTASPSRTLQQVYDLAQKALTIDKGLGSAHRLLATTYYKRQKYDLASSEIDRALKLNPNDADAYDALGAVKLYDGDPGGAIKAVNTALRFNPNLGPSGLVHLGLAYYLEGQYQDAIKTFDLAVGKNPGLVVLHVGLAASHAMANNSSKAENAAAKVRLLNPFFKVDVFGNAFRKVEDQQKIREGLRKAGLS